jgi:hypothetical protein
MNYDCKKVLQCWPLSSFDAKKTSKQQLGDVFRTKIFGPTTNKLERLFFGKFFGLVCYLEPTRVEHFTLPPHMGSILASLTNVRLARKSLTRTNGLAYLWRRKKMFYNMNRVRFMSVENRVVPC